jgi:hypothetical protein
MSEPNEQPEPEEQPKPTIVAGLTITAEAEVVHADGTKD